MSDQSDADVEEQFPAYLATQESDEGKLNTIHICGTIDQARQWREKQTAKGALTKSSSPASDRESDKVSIRGRSEDEKGYAEHLDKLISSIRSFYDLISINASVRVIFPNIYIDREFNDLRSNLPLLDENSVSKLYGVPEDRISMLNTRMRKLNHIEEGLSTISANVLMGLVARFDANISSLVRFMLKYRKETLLSSDKSISIKYILAAQSFDELIDEIVEDEIHSLMRGSHEEQIKYIEENFSIEIRSGFKRWANFVEIFERRNLAAHGEGFVNSRYDQNCNKAGVDEKARLGFGEKVELDDSYLRYSTDILLEFGILLIWWLWLKQSPSDAPEVYNKINSATYDLILDKRYKLSARILESVLSRKTHDAPETLRRMMAVNLANCYKKLQDERKFERTLKMFDWSASADQFKISIAALEEDVEKFCSLMSRVTEDELVGKIGFRDWPVFDWVRDDERVRMKFKDIYGEPLEVASKARFDASREEVSEDESLDDLNGTVH